MPHKVCPECKIKNGVRSHSCQCGFNFVENPTTKVKSAELVLNGTIITPSGPCKIKPDGSAEDDVKRWATNVYLWGKQSGRVFSIEAIQYFARSFWNINEPEYGPIKIIIEKHLSSGKPNDKKKDSTETEHQKVEETTEIAQPIGIA